MDDRDADGADWNDDQWDQQDGNDEKEPADTIDESGGNVAGAFRPATEIVPETPSLESALFVVAGAYIAVLALTRMFVDPAGFSARDVLVLTGGTLGLAVVAFVFYGLVPGRDPGT